MRQSQLYESHAMFIAFSLPACTFFNHAPQREYMDMVNHYYNLATDFYEYGWGSSFHFAPRLKGETFESSLKRHEHFLALRLGLAPQHKVTAGAVTAVCKSAHNS
jgi:hypothetical protein